MSHEDIFFDDGFRQENFVDSLDFIRLSRTVDSLDPESATAVPSVLHLDLAAGVGVISNAQMRGFFGGYLASLAQQGATPDWTTFSSGWVDYINDLPIAIGMLTTPNLYNALYNGFFASIGSTVQGDGSTMTGDWSILQGPPNPVTPTFNFNSLSAANNPFIASLNHFLQNIDWSLYSQTIDGNGSGGSANTIQFAEDYQKFLGQVAILQRAEDTNDPTGLALLPSYKDLYFAFGPPGATDTDFAARVQQFYQDEVLANGYFLPSQAVAHWIETLRIENGFNAVGPPRTEVINSLVGNSSEKAIIINRILLLIIKIIKSLQDVGIVQANHLRFTTQFQQAYTALQTQIPVFLQDGTDPIGLDTTDAATIRNDLNASFNTILTDNLRALRGLQEDSAKKQQSDVNQTNDAVNQQTDMATTFIQQLSTLLSTIFR